MSATTVSETIVGTFITLCLAGVLVWAGWHEPLSYRFKTRAQIAEIEAQNAPPPPVPFGSSGTSLDRAPYRRVSDGRIFYTRRHDPRHLGVSSETERRGNQGY